MSYYVDILEPPKDLNQAVDILGAVLGGMYHDAWEENMRAFHDNKPFSLNAPVFVNMWTGGVVKLFAAYNDKKEPVGFLIGMVFRPLPYEANVFQIEEWYAKPEVREEVEPMLFEHAVNAVRYIGCDEIWTAGNKDGSAPSIPNSWKLSNCFKKYRFTKA